MTEPEYKNLVKMFGKEYALAAWRCVVYGGKKHLEAYLKIRKAIR